MNREETLRKAVELAENSTIAYVGTSDGEGYPNIKAMFKMENEGLTTFWFSTNTSSKRVSQLRNNAKACIYLVEPQSFKGLMLVGEIVVLNDLENKKRLWRPGNEMYYPKGVEDPDYSVLKFTAKWCNFYHDLCNVNLNLEPI